MNGRSEHYLPEPTLNLTLDRKNVESYMLFNESATRQVTLKDYVITDSEYVKSLLNQIDDKVMNHSESTYEVKPINYELELKNVLEQKDEANKLINTKVDEAISIYRKIIFDIEDCTKGLTDRDFEKSEVLRKIFEQKKLIMSNLSLAYTKKQIFKESIELDLYILGIDRKFEKSYGRLINAYCQLDQLDQANHYANTMKSIFGSSVIDKYAGIFENLETKNRKADENLRLISKRSNLNSKKESEIISEIGDEKDDENQLAQTKKEKEGFGSKFFKFLFGTSMIVGSSVWLYYLFKNKSKYMK